MGEPALSYDDWPDDCSEYVDSDQLPPRVANGHLGPYTAERFLNQPDDGVRRELVDGWLVMSAAPIDYHQAFIFRLASELITRQPDDEYEVLGDINAVLSTKRVYRSDLVLLRRSKLSGTAGTKAEDIFTVVEVVSPGSERMDRNVKQVDYAEARIRWHWRVEPGQGFAVYVYELEKSTKAYLMAGAAVPGKPFTVPEPFEFTIDVDRLARGRPAPGDDREIRAPESGRWRSVPASRQPSLYSSSNRRPTIIFWISAVPSPIRSIGASR